MPQPGDREATPARHKVRVQSERETLRETDRPGAAGGKKDKAGKAKPGKKDKPAGKDSGKKADRKAAGKAAGKDKSGKDQPRFDPQDVPDPAEGTLIEVRQSGVHGKGVYAIAPIKRGQPIIEYVGRIMSHKKADRLPPIDPDDPNHTFFFQIRDGKKVIDAAVGGSAARWINHACAPNCEAEEDEDSRVFIRALRRIKPGEELFYDYGLVLDEPYTKKLKREYACRCGAKTCRGMMLAPKD